MGVGLSTRKLVYTMQQFLNLLVCLKVVLSSYPILIMMGSGFWSGYVAIVTRTRRIALSTRFLGWYLWHNLSLILI